MNDQTNPEQPAVDRAGPPEAPALSLMAVQELLGLFLKPQSHTERVLKTAGKTTTDLQAALEDKPLTYL